MTHNKFEIFKKLINYITKNGKKIKSEKILLQTIKELQKPFKKQSKKIIQLSLVLSSPLFKLFVITNKKRKKNPSKLIPTFVSTQSVRMSLAIKSIIQETRINKNVSFYKELKTQMIQINQTESNVLPTL